MHRHTKTCTCKGAVSGSKNIIIWQVMYDLVTTAAMYVLCHLKETTIFLWKFTSVVRCKLRLIL